MEDMENNGLDGAGDDVLVQDEMTLTLRKPVTVGKTAKSDGVVYARWTCANRLRASWRKPRNRQPRWASC